MSDHHVSVLLERTGRLTLAVAVLRAACAAVSFLLGFGLLALVFDAVLGLKTWGLISVDLVLLALVVGALAFTACEAWKNLYNPRRVARQIEEQLNIRDSSLINSVDLGGAVSTSSSRQLVLRSLQNGEELAANLSSIQGVNYRRVLKAAAIAAGTMLILLVSYFVAPRLFAMVLPRYLDPTGDHPPYSLLDFEVTITPETVYHGRPATIAVALSGPDAVEHANVVFLNGEQRQHVPMFRNVDGVFILPIEQADATRDFYIDTPKGRSKRYRFTVLRVPFFEDANVSYEFPEYTQWPSSRHVLDSRGIRALEGTQITITSRANLPLRSGQLELFDVVDSKSDTPSREPSRTITLSPTQDDATTVSGKFLLASSGQYRLTLIGADGAPSLERLEGRIVSAADRLPQVAIVQPDSYVAAVEGWKIPVVVQATDDVGIDRITMLVGVNGWGPDSVPLGLQSDQPTVVRGHYEFDLGELGARAGDIITYYASAYDNHPSGQHFTDTSLYVIQVISLDEYTEYARQKYQMEQLVKEFEETLRKLDDLKSKRQKLLDELSQLQEKQKEGKQLSDEELQKLEQLEKQLQEFSDQTEALAKELGEQAEQTQLYEFEKPYRERLQRLSKQLEKQAANANALQKQAAALRKQSGDSQTRQAFQDAAQKFAKEDDPFGEQDEQLMQETQEDLEKLQKADDLLAGAERLRAVILQQRDLADRLGQYRDRQKLSDDELRRIQRLAKEQDLLRQELEDAKAALQHAAEAAEDDLPKMSGGAKKLCQAIDELRVDDDQSQASRSARLGDGRKAFTAAESAAKKLETLLSDCCNPKGATQSGDLDGCLSLPKPGMEKSLKQLSQGRSIPGMGQKGGDGAGLEGSRAQMSIYGPHQMSQGDSDSRQSAGLGERGPGGRGRGYGQGEASSAESINPEARQTTRTGVGSMRGVPVGYRDQAEAYFQRLAEEK